MLMDFPMLMELLWMAVTQIKLFDLQCRSNQNEKTLSTGPTNFVIES
jgi:hypothetical protein